MKNILLIAIIIFFELNSTIGQTVSDSIYSSWWANKNSSIFREIDNGQYSGTTSGYLQVVLYDNDTLVLDFQSTSTKLDIEKDTNQIYDNSTKHYSTKTTSGKTILSYDTYALANILTIAYNGEYYNIGAIDGACDMPVLGLSFNYCNEQVVEYLTLFATNSLKLTTIQYLMKTQQISYLDAVKIARTLIVLPGSTIIFTIEKKSGHL